MPQLLTVGEFARVTHLSIRTLRRYHASRLLIPARVDESNGYRYYAPEQIPVAQVVHRLRELDLPLAEVQQVVNAVDPAERADLISAHLHRLEQQLERTRAAVASLEVLLRPAPADFPVELRHVDESVVAGVRASVELGDVLPWYAGAMAELDAAVATPTGQPGGLYDDSLFARGRGTALVYLPTQDPPTLGRIRPEPLPAADLAVVTHVGDHDTIDVTYGRLGRWVAENPLGIVGPVRELYVRGPRDDPNPASWRTEIAWPVFGIAPLPR